MSAEDYFDITDMEVTDPFNDENYAGDGCENLIWKQKDGSPIRVGDMEDSHLRNTALMLMGMGYQKYNAPNMVKINWLTAFRTEWERRMKLRAQGKLVRSVK